MYKIVLMLLYFNLFLFKFCFYFVPVSQEIQFIYKYHFSFAFFGKTKFCARILSSLQSVVWVKWIREMCGIFVAGVDLRTHYFVLRLGCPNTILYPVVWFLSKYKVNLTQRKLCPEY